MKKSGKKWISFDFDTEEPKSVAGNVNSSNGFGDSVKPAKKSETGAISGQKKRSFNFEQRLRPRTVADLAVHPKKVKEVEVWLENNVKNRQKCAKFLLMTGPTGCGKTATVRVLCENMAINVCEWVNPVDQDFEVFRGPNQVTRFSDFLTESKWNSLFATSDEKIILVEEFPNALMRNPQDFSSVLEECYYKGNFPVIFICTDSFDSGKNLSETLFPPEMRTKYQISQISFNPCAPTVMKSALKRANNLVQENLDLFKTPSNSTVDAILASSMGDIRCAVNQYYFASLLGTSDLPTVPENNLKKTGSKRKRNENSSIKAMTRDEHLGLFHGLGRILNPKRTEMGGSLKLNCDIQKLVDEFSIQPGIFTHFLFENYVKYFGDINDVCKASEILSFSQIFLEKWDRHETLMFALWTAILGLMLYNEHKVSKWNQIKGPRKIKKRVNTDPNTRNLSATDLFYYDLITKPQLSNSFHNY